MSLFQQMHSEWQIALEHLKQEIDLIDVRIDPNNVTPHYSNIMRVFSQPISKVKVVIAGQDPYPGAGHAQGLAFSVTSKTLPASLRNIFRELSDDLNTPLRTNGDLSDWAPVATNPGAVGEVVTVLHTVPSGADQQFLRLRMR